jgi:hypothetical protein
MLAKRVAMLAKRVAMLANQVLTTSLIHANF